MAPVFLMSIRPEYASEIIAGRKKVELRRLDGRRPVTEGSRVVIYSSGGVQSLVGEFRAHRVLIGLPEKVWTAVSSPSLGVRVDSWRYIAGSRRAMAIYVAGVRRYQTPIHLSKIRKMLPWWNPPLSYRLLEDGDPVLELIIKEIAG